VNHCRCDARIVLARSSIGFYRYRLAVSVCQKGFVAYTWNEARKFPDGHGKSGAPYRRCRLRPYATRRSGQHQTAGAPYFQRRSRALLYCLIAQGCICRKAVVQNILAHKAVFGDKLVSSFHGQKAAIRPRPTNHPMPRGHHHHPPPESIYRQVDMAMSWPFHARLSCDHATKRLNNEESHTDIVA
jgi:hypothetical protein